MQHAELSSLISAQPDDRRAVMRLAAEQLIDCYSSLSVREAQLLGDLLGDDPPRQWRHYPNDDAIDRSRGYQYFYHSHAPEDREASGEHGHFHLFARIDSGLHRIDEGAEQGFLQRLQAQSAVANTANLMCISLDAKGVPTTLFTVNRWVTGDHLFSAMNTLRLLANFNVEMGESPLLNQWIGAMVRLFWPQVEALLTQRDLQLRRHAKRRGQPGLLDDANVEVLSIVPIDIDTQISLLAR